MPDGWLNSENIGLFTSHLFITHDDTQALQTRATHAYTSFHSIREHTSTRTRTLSVCTILHRFNSCFVMDAVRVLPME